MKIGMIAKKVMFGLMCLGATGLTNNVAVASDHSTDTMYQVALLQSLTAGYYDGLISVAELKKNGDTGIGTFQGVNGEMIVLDGHVYQALWDGSVVEASDDETVPFSNVTFFNIDGQETVNKVTSFSGLKAILDDIVNKNGDNEFYMVKVKGHFNNILVRSELKQQKPYRTLAEALATDQREFTYDNIDGTMVVLYCPPYMTGLNTPGWHFHFISDDKKKGGHVLNAELNNGTIYYDLTASFNMILPDNSAFNTLNLSADQSRDIKKVEQSTASEMK